MVGLVRWLCRTVVAVSLLAFIAAATTWWVTYRKPATVWWTRVGRLDDGRELPHGFFIEAWRGRITVGDRRRAESRLPDGKTLRQRLVNEIEMAEAYARERTTRARNWNPSGSWLERDRIERERDTRVAAWSATLAEYEQAMAWAKPGAHGYRTPASRGGADPPPAWEWAGIEYRGWVNGRQRAGALSVPVWMVVAATAVAPFAAILGMMRQARRRRSGCCRRCGYDLRASTAGCPECGDGRRDCLAARGMLSD